MAAQQIFEQTFVYLVTAVLAVPVAKRLGLGSVLGYLIGGIVIGPYVLRLVGSEGEDVMHFAEFGVVLMLFLIGLELQPRLLWRLRAPILGLGGLQVTITGAIIAGIGIVSGLAWQVAVAVGCALALSSTAIVLQTLEEKGTLKSDGGQGAFSVLLFQDVAVIPMLALFPLLATLNVKSGGHGDGHHGEGSADHGTSWVEGLPPWGETLAVLGAVVLIIVAGRFLVRPMLRFIARARLREVFTAAALLLVIGIALLMSKVGLSPALGTFLAGVVLADSEYRHELESDIDPFKGLLLGVFFIAVGASIDFDLIAGQPGLIAGLVGALILVKFVVLLALGRAFRMGFDQNLLFAFALAQGGEFAFVLFSFGVQNGVVPLEVASPLIAAVAMTMALTPLLLLLEERVIRPRIGTREQVEREPDEMHESNPVIIAGFGDFGNVVGRLLRANGIETTVLEFDSDRVELLRRLDLRVFYGDATRTDLLRAAGAEQARILVIALDDPDQVSRLVEVAHKHFPHLEICARAAGRVHAYELLEAGVKNVYRQTLDTSLQLGVDVLRVLGMPALQANRAADTFRKHDEEALQELAAMRHDQKAYLSRAREMIAQLEATLETDQIEEAASKRDAAWDVESLRADFGGTATGYPEGGDDSRVT
jgi:monovalent cation:proton antiporter-2 (CPA2) family protein